MQASREISTITNSLLNLRDMKLLQQRDLFEIISKIHSSIKNCEEIETEKKSKQMPFFHGAKNEKEVKDSFSGVKINDK